MPVQDPKRGAIPSPRSALASATPHVAIVGAPPNFITLPAQISMWGNDVNGDCVTAEEAFAKACNSPEIFIPDSEVISWATRHGVLNGAVISQVLQWMQSDGFQLGSFSYDDGPYFSVNWTNSATLQSAISNGPVKIGVAADQLLTAWHSTNGTTGWFAVGFHADGAEDHCPSLCGYGTINWLAQQLHVQVPAGIDGTKTRYALFTWNSIGIIDEPSLLAITQEAWLRQPTTETRGEWASLGGGITTNPCVSRNADGRLEVFARGTDNALWHIWQNSAGGGWSGWASLGGGITSDPAVGINHDGRLEAFARGTDNALWHIWQNSAGGGWSGWASLGGGITGDPAVGINLDGRLEAFARGTDNALWHIWQNSAGGGWSGWASLGGGLTGSAAEASNLDGRLEVFVRGTDGALWHRWQVTPG